MNNGKIHLQKMGKKRERERGGEIIMKFDGWIKGWKIIKKNNIKQHKT